MAVVSLNDRALMVGKQIIDCAGELDAEPLKVAGAHVIDAGVNVRGTINLGLEVARACMADLGTVQVEPGHVGDWPIPYITVTVNHPVAACMASQYAGWQISVGKYFAMGSGPMRAAYGKEELFDDIGMRERPGCATGVLESGQIPNEDVIEHIAKSCVVARDRVGLIVARTASIAGGVQVVARSVETAMHKLHVLKFDLRRVVGGFGSAPLPPVATDDLAAIGRTNDSVLYGAEVILYVTGEDELYEELGPKLPSSSSNDYGEPFGAIFKKYNHDFYAIDPMLFSPAMVVFQNLDTGNSFRFGQTNHDVLTHSFFGQ